ncbi:MAG: DUF2157 domain-containing protein [Selenomonadales bacterium]|nr:DUF2157 domain-containing protein [Selenomonadales bacterium]
MKKSHQTWLKEQAAKWVEKDIITSSQAERILAEYPEQQILPMTFQRTFSALGAILIAIGVLLVLAHNWDALSRGVRLTSMVVLLLVSQGATLATMHIERFARYREGVALFLSLMVGGTLILMGQTFYLGIDTSWLFGVWMVLILPIAFLTETASPVFAYAVLFFIWLTQAHDAWYIWFSWPLLLMLIPLQRRFEENETSGFHVLTWMIVIGLVTSFLVCLRPYFGDLAVQIMALFFYRMSALGVELNRADELWNRPLFSLGFTGSLFCMFLLTFYNLWHHSSDASGSTPVIVFAVMFAIALFSVWQNSRRMRGDLLARFSALAVPIVGFTSLLWLCGMPDWLAVGIMNAYLIIVGIYLMVRGYVRQQVSIFNVGMLLITALIVARLFDVDMNFLVRGILYIVLGVVFFGVNYRMRKQKGGATSHEITAVKQVESVERETQKVASDNGQTNADDRPARPVLRVVETDDRAKADEPERNADADRE